MSNKTILRLLYGGKSAEHDVSLQTALSVINALDFEKFEVLPVYITLEGKWIQGAKLSHAFTDVKELVFEENGINDVFPSQFFSTISEGEVVFPLLHGPNGEDGTVQGLLELLNVAYVGNGVAASAISMDKVFMKQIFAEYNLNQPNYQFFMKKDWQENFEKICRTVEQSLGFPCFVKPANLGSSVGISKCETIEELRDAFELAFEYDQKVIVEEGIVGREIEIAVLGNENPSCSVAGEIIPEKEFYDYQAKYEDGNTALIIPAEISEAVYEKLKEMAIKAFKAVGGNGLVRADFFVTKNDEVLINEINTMPGFTPFSMYPLLWKHSGIDYPQLIEKLVQLAVERHQEKQQIKHTMF
ncbi:D-alanine--D-alanine ligase [Pueribacillus theae]|uniref:D-alanine--D-alanine ligase n=1 Tax=Pueribacillus theae TaxID=2171751 RepID=A0A2U1JR78_9BACI|nr:D-alanine--D-alanine ligase [Pueribacillus theae]PWA07697.1 D-alanine--D-alanine ligase [Pueribacillus theae]